jgi:hypothetical protein
MSDYLGTLAARSLGLVSVARPRLAARFEPDAHAPSHMEARGRTDDVAAATAGDVPSMSKPRLVVTPAPPPSAPKSDGTTAHRHGPRIDNRAQSPQANDHRAAASSVAAPRAPSIDPPPLSFPRSPHPQERLDRAPTAPATVLPTSASRHVAVTHGPQEPPAQRLDPDVRRMKDLDDRLTTLERRPPRQNAPMQRESMIRPAPQVTGDRRPTPAAPAMRISASPIELPDSAPAVHVTIGRVDVRAIVAPAPRARTRATPPRTSLEEYLKQRSPR